jgi:hypothetical protein
MLNLNYFRGVEKENKEYLSMKLPWDVHNKDWSDFVSKFMQYMSLKS